MNFLAHSFLANTNEPLLVGNFIADFIRGSNTSIYPQEVQKGIALHRFIDIFMDTHPLSKQSSLRLQSNLGKYAPVVVDVFYDHFLAQHWALYSVQTLETFAQETYRILASYQEILPPKAKYVLPYMISQNWLPNYAHLTNIDKALQRLAQRAKYDNNIAQAGLLLEKYYHDLEQDFLAFFPDMIQQTTVFLQNLQKQEQENA